MIILKVRSNEGWETHKIQDFPCRVGRAADNDVVIDDESVSSRHAMIDITAAGYVLLDTGSTNGIRLKKKLQKEIAISRPTEVFLGKVAVLLRSSKDLSEKTVNLNVQDVQGSSFLQDHPVKLAGAAFLATALFSVFAGKVLEPDEKWSLIVGKEIGILTLTLFIAAGFVVWSKIQNGRYRVWETFYFIFVVVFLFQILLGFGDFVVFNVNTRWIDAFFVGGGTLAILYFGIHSFSNILYPTARRLKRFFVNTGILASLVGLVYGVSLIEKVRNERATMSNVIAYPIRSFVGESYGFDRLDSQFAKLEKELEKQRKEALEKNQTQ